jgi:acyl-CoA hydrolase
VVSTEWVQPNDTNAIDIAHGGNVVKWMDEVGGLSAIRFCGEPCVTASMRRVDFHHPIKLGNAATLRSYVYKVGRTSLQVCIRVIGENLLESTEKLTTQSYFTYVAIDENQNPVEVPELTVETEDEEEKRQRALEGFKECEEIE